MWILAPMTSRRRLVLTVMLLIVCAGVTIVLLVRGHGNPGAGLATVLGDTKAAIEQWCGKQLLAVANSHLRPELSFSKLEFQLPATVTLTDVRLSDQGIAVIEAKAMRV